MKKTGCALCGADIIYLEKEQTLECAVCKKTFTSNAKCENNHFVCDECHKMDAVEYIEYTCLTTNKTSIMELTLELMNNHNVLMHGPEHHFLVPAVLYTLYAHTYNKHDELAEKLEIIKERAKKVPGGFCGQFGCCGAGVGTGIFMSVLLGNTPLSENSWGDAHLMTAKTLEALGHLGGPRCCKRSTFQALKSAQEFLSEKFNITLPLGEQKCDFVELNPTCLYTQCPFF